MVEAREPAELPDPTATAAARDVTVVVPAYDEEAALERTVVSLLEGLAALEVTHSLVVVDDGSRDRTGEIADRLAEKHPNVTALHQENTGIGGALTTGFGAVDAEYVLIWPADMPCVPTDLAPYFDNLGRADVIVGCRQRRAGYNPLMRFNAALYPHLVRLLFGLRLRDVNWICLYRARLIRAVDIRSQGIPMLTEILVRIRDRGGTFQEVDVEMRARESGVPSAARPRVMVRTLVELVRVWWSWRSEQAGGRPARGPA